MALLTVARGTSVITENRIRKTRFMHAAELAKMGADITIDGNAATVNGRQPAPCGSSPRYRSTGVGAAMIIAAQMAHGVTEISEIHHIERGYEDYGWQARGHRHTNQNRRGLTHFL